jgi:hypothetical protein
MFQTQDFDDLTHNEYSSGHRAISFDRPAAHSTFCVTSPERTDSGSLPPPTQGGGKNCPATPERCPDRTGTLSGPSRMAPESCPATSGTLSDIGRNPVRIESESVSEWRRNTQLIARILRSNGAIWREGIDTPTKRAAAIAASMYTEDIIAQVRRRFTAGSTRYPPSSLKECLGGAMIRTGEVGKIQLSGEEDSKRSKSCSRRRCKWYRSWT